MVGQVFPSVRSPWCDVARRGAVRHEATRLTICKRNKMKRNHTSKRTTKNDLRVASLADAIDKSMHYTHFIFYGKRQLSLAGGDGTSPRAAPFSQKADSYSRPTRAYACALSIVKQNSGWSCRCRAALLLCSKLPC